MTGATVSANGDLGLFIELSSRLTGVAVEEDIAGEYLARVRAEPFGDKIDPLIALFRSLKANPADLEAAIRSQIVESAEFGVLANQLTLLWYTSAFLDTDKWKFGTPDQYFRALIWPAVGAHPPALSGGYFGYWKYPPEN
jgi:hypothetical protein